MQYFLASSERYNRDVSFMYKNQLSFCNIFTHSIAGLWLSYTLARALRKEAGSK